MTINACYQFQTTTAAGMNNVVLAFVSGQERLVHAGLAQSSRTTVISFGERDRAELAKACTSVDQQTARVELETVVASWAKWRTRVDSPNRTAMDESQLWVPPSGAELQHLIGGG